MTSGGSRKSRLSFFCAPDLRAWQGRMALSVVFRGYGNAISTAVAILHAIAPDAGQMIFQQVPILIPVASTMWILIAIWRRVPNISPIQSILARSSTATPWLNTVFVLFFLQRELKPSHAGG